MSHRIKQLGCQAFRLDWDGGPAAPGQSTLTSRHHDVSGLHRGLDVLLKRWFHKLVVLLDDAADVAPALGNVPLEPPDQTDVRVCVHKDLHVQQLEDKKRTVSVSSGGPGSSQRLESRTEA